MRKSIFQIAVLALALMLVLSACGTAPAAPTSAPAAPANTEAPAPTVAPTTGAAPAPSYTIPDIQSGKFNVAIVLIGYENDGGWSQAHTVGGQ